MFNKKALLLTIGLYMMATISNAGGTGKAPTILCLGDSITEGTNYYRHILNDKLLEAGYCVSFIGPKSSEKSGVLLKHAGYSGKNTGFLDEHFEEIYREHPADIILLHSVHNSFAKHKPVKKIISGLESIIAKARKINSKVKILLAQGIISGKLPKYSYIPELNVEIAGLAKRMNKKDQPVILVDQSAGFDWQTDTCDDKVHPNTEGATKMAQKWFDTLMSLPEFQNQKDKHFLLK